MSSFDKRPESTNPNSKESRVDPKKAATQEELGLNRIDPFVGVIWEKASDKTAEVIVAQHRISLRMGPQGRAIVVGTPARMDTDAPERLTRTDIEAAVKAATTVMKNQELREREQGRPMVTAEQLRALIDSLDNSKNRKRAP